MALAAAVVLGGMLAVMLAAWALQRTLSNSGWVDVFWTFGTGAACAAMALWPAPAESAGRQWLAAALGIVWSLRLGLYIAARVARSAEDARYAHLKRTWGADYQRRLFGFVLAQAPATALMTLSVFVAAHAGAGELGARDALGALILAIAIAGEGLADEQMRRFKARDERGPIMEEGLWGWSRHPNYFFEWLGWLAYPAMAFDPGQPITWLTWIAPLLMYVILRHGTGVPALEGSMLRTRGDAFRDYQARVSVFFPRPPRRRAT
ncbi:MAG: DUF1295 domain-containing protein [Hyphomonadaceae bacterium]|nr:DUF1295 domain-containing protein [Hyphomonadaceae bacterium]